MAIELTTEYLGLRLKNPLVMGASPLADDLDVCRRLEDAGCAAIVVHSLFEEQITSQQTGRIRHLDPLDPQFAGVLAQFPQRGTFALGPDEYVEHLRKLKQAVSVPVIASLNGTTPEAWLSYARKIEAAGADALELNMYEVVTDPDQSAASIERTLYTVVSELRREIRLPLAAKLSPYFTALGHVAGRLEAAGAAGLVLFNRFYQPDIDIRDLSAAPTLALSDSSELLLRLRWVAILRSRVKASLAVTGGVAAPADAIKALLAGADAVQMVSAILRHGPQYFAVVLDGLRQWMDAHGFASIGEVRGRVSLAAGVDADAFERANYLRMLASWHPGPS